MAPRLYSVKKFRMKNRKKKNVNKLLYKVYCTISVPHHQNPWDYVKNLWNKLFSRKEFIFMEGKAGSRHSRRLLPRVEPISFIPQDEHILFQQQE